MRAGLPKKYAKMGFKRGWREYKASRAGGQKKRRRAHNPGNPGNPGTTRRARRSPRRSPRTIIQRVTSRRGVNQMARTATNTAWAVGGAAAAQGIVSMLPMVNPVARGLTQMGLGLVAGLAAPRRGAGRVLIPMAVGATVAGGLSMSRTIFPQLPLLAGTVGPRRVPYYGPRPAGRNQMGANTTFRDPTAANAGYMGANIRWGRGRMSGYGPNVLNAYQ
jgi:hypothetical protein